MLNYMILNCYIRLYFIILSFIIGIYIKLCYIKMFNYIITLLYDIILYKFFILY